MAHELYLKYFCKSIQILAGRQSLLFPLQLPANVSLLPNPLLLLAALVWAAWAECINFELAHLKREFLLKGTLFFHLASNTILKNTAISDGTFSARSICFQSGMTAEYSSMALYNKSRGKCFSGTKVLFNRTAFISASRTWINFCAISV